MQRPNIALYQIPATAATLTARSRMSTCKWGNHKMPGAAVKQAFKQQACRRKFKLERQSLVRKSAMHTQATNGWNSQTQYRTQAWAGCTMFNRRVDAIFDTRKLARAKQRGEIKARVKLLQQTQRVCFTREKQKREGLCEPVLSVSNRCTW